MGRSHLGLLIGLGVIVAVAAIGIAGGAAFLSGCGAASSAAPNASPSPTAQPPDWLLKRMTGLARSAGDPNASAWWTLTAADKAVVALEGGTRPANPSIASPSRAAYVSVVHGDFTNWLWSAPSTAFKPHFSWVIMEIDANSHIADEVKVTDEPFDVSVLKMQSVILPSAPAH